MIPKLIGVIIATVFVWQFQEMRGQEARGLTILFFFVAMIIVIVYEEISIVFVPQS